MRITVNNNAFPEDQEFEIPGIGLVKNHEPTEVTPQQRAMYDSLGFVWEGNGDLVIDQNEPEPPKTPISDTNIPPPPAVGSSTQGAPDSEEDN